MDDLEPVKRRLRAWIKTRLAVLSAAEREEKSRRLRALLAAADFWPSLSTVAAFVPLPDEPDLRPLLERALEEGKSLLLPRMDGEALVFHAARNLEQDLVPHRYGMAEPSPRLPCPNWEEVRGGRALILVPGLAFDNRGGRLGRGKGFYDRFLSGFPGCMGEQPLQAATSPGCTGGQLTSPGSGQPDGHGSLMPLILGAAFSCQLVESVPAGAGDFFLHGLVTEERIVWSH